MNLLIDTHLNETVLITFKNNSIIKKKTIENDNCSSKYIMPLIKKILDKDKLQSIIVVNGPGSFTGVRLGVTIAKSLAYTLNIPVKTISSLECLALSSKNDDGHIVGFSDNNGYYLGIFDKNLNKVGEFSYLKNNDFEKFNERCKVETNLSIDYLNVIKYCENRDATNAHEVNPIYIKKLDVEKND